MNRAEAITRLVNSSEFSILQQKCVEYLNTQRKFDLLSVYSEILDENALTRLLAYLLDSNQYHGIGQTAFRTFLSVIERENSEVSAFVKAIPSDSLTKTISEVEWVTTENKRLDILIRLTDMFGNSLAVIGIENKVDSGEQNEQLKNYQKAIVEKFPKVPSVIFYLSPNGRKSETSESSYSCPVHPVSYKAISDTCSILVPKLDGQPQLFINILKSYIDRIANLDIMDNDIKRVVSSLYKDESHRQAMKLLQKYTPRMRNVFEGVCNVLKAENSLPFTFDNQGIDYWPRSSDSPAEFKLYIKEFEDFNCRFTPTYLFVCDSSSPDIEDNYTLRLSLWADPALPIDREKKKDIIERLSGAFQMPQNLSSGKNWSSWVTVWSGNTYKIQDMDEIDVKNLSEILISGIRNTYTNLKEGMERLRKYPLP